jgi:hypothetical protein
VIVIAEDFCLPGTLVRHVVLTLFPDAPPRGLQDASLVVEMHCPEGWSIVISAAFGYASNAAPEYGASSSQTRMEIDGGCYVPRAEVRPKSLHQVNICRPVTKRYGLRARRVYR